MRKINRIVIHCSATKHSLDIGAKEIRQWHTAAKPLGNGWSDIGYHYVIRRNGMVDSGRPVGVSGAHAKGFNSSSIGVCLVGGLDRKGRPSVLFDERQMASLRELVNSLMVEYDVKADMVVGHRDLPNVNKDCPCFQVKKWLIHNELLA